MGTQIGALVLGAAMSLVAVNDVSAASLHVRALVVAGGCSLPRDVKMNPDACFKASGIKWKDSGIVRSYRELSEVTLNNTSVYDITDIQGEMTWMKADGTTVGTTTFSLSGVVPAGATTTFSQAAKNLTGSKLQTDAPSYTLRLSSADIHAK